MSKHEAGDRVGAILSADKDSVRFLGYGTYAGRKVPHKGAGGMAGMMAEVGLTNPRIDLDSGEVVYGCECWWGSATKIEEMIGDREVIKTSIDAVRAEHAKDESP